MLRFVFFFIVLFSNKYAISLFADEMNRISWITGLFGGLMISSCCVIQLFLNLFGIGCAGLNTLLLPYRSLFISLTIISLTYSYYRYRPSKWHFLSILTLTVTLSCSPEILRIYNNQFSTTMADANKLGESRITHWKIIGMHCEGCRSGVIHALRKLPGVSNVNVDLKSDRTELTSSNDLNSDQVMQVVQSAGFQAEKLDE